MKTVIVNKAEKGSVVALHSMRSSHDIKMKKTVYDCLELAVATKVDREGRVVEALRIGYAKPTKVDNKTGVYVISDPERQALARKVYDASPLGTTWPSIVDLRHAIDNAVDKATTH